MKSFLIFSIVALFFISACSSEPSTEVRSGNEGFVIGNGSVGVLLTHGLGASPYEVKGLAHYLADRNLTVYVVRLAGHGTSVEDLNARTWEEWYKSYSEAYLSVKPLKQKVFVGGMSLGGALALKLAEDESVSGVIALAPALSLDDSRSNYAWLYKYFSPYSSRNISEQNLPYYYHKFPVASVAEAVSFSKIVKKDLSKIDEPLLLMQYKEDNRVLIESSQMAYDLSSSTDKELVWLDGSGHVFLLDDSKEVYFETIYQFIASHS